jgi:hypothetical protein
MTYPDCPLSAHSIYKLDHILDDVFLVIITMLRVD